MCCASAKLAWFGGISELLGDIGSFEKIRELSLAGTDELFVMRWTCLSLVAIRQILETSEMVPYHAIKSIEMLAAADDTGRNDALAAAQKIDETVKKASNCLYRLFDELSWNEDLTEEVEEILRGHESQISELEQINIEANRLEAVDDGIFDMQNIINFSSCRFFSQFPRVFDDFEVFDWAPMPFSRVVELSGDPRKLQFIHPRQTLKSMCSPALTLRNILEGQGDTNAYKELRKNLVEFCVRSRWGGNEMKRQLWRLQDLYAGGLGFTVELFFLALEQLLSKSSSALVESHETLYMATFRAITSDWSKHKHSLGTQNLLLDIAMSRRSEFEYGYFECIADEFLLLLGNIFEGQTGPHIDRTRRQVESIIPYEGKRVLERLLRVLAPEQAQSLAS